LISLLWGAHLRRLESFVEGVEEDKARPQSQAGAASTAHAREPLPPGIFFPRPLAPVGIPRQVPPAGILCKAEASTGIPCQSTLSVSRSVACALHRRHSPPRRYPPSPSSPPRYSTSDSPPPRYRPPSLTHTHRLVSCTGDPLQPEQVVWRSPDGSSVLPLGISSVPPLGTPSPFPLYPAQATLCNRSMWCGVLPMARA
jgi:hypothetical protein